MRPQVDHERVRRLTQAGWSASRIADDMRITERSVTRIRSRLGIAKPTPGGAYRPSPELWQKVEAAINDGWSYIEISRTYHITPDTVRARYPGRGWTMEQKNELGRITRAANKEWGRGHVQERDQQHKQQGQQLRKEGSEGMVA